MSSNVPSSISGSTERSGACSCKVASSAVFDNFGKRHLSKSKKFCWSKNENYHQAINLLINLVINLTYAWSLVYKFRVSYSIMGQ